MSKESINDDVIICLSDLWALLRRGKYFIWCSILTMAVLFSSYALFKTPSFKAQATFREKQRSSGGVGSNSAKSLLSMLGPLGDSNSSFAIPILTSRTLIEGMIQDCGMQMHILPEGKTLRLI